MTELLLAGGGHSHLEVLRRFASARDRSLAVTLVSPHTEHVYSGMLPGVAAGHYAEREARIALAPLAQAAGARFLPDTIASLDLDARRAKLATGAVIPFDVLSLDVGSVPDASVTGASHAIPVKPIDPFLAHFDATRADAASARVRQLAVVGGGAGGVEILLAMQHRLVRELGPRAPRWSLVTDQATLVPQHGAGVRRRLERVLDQRKVTVHICTSVAAVEPNAVLSAEGARIAADRIFWATSAAAPAWLRATDLACDERGFVLVNDFLQSTTHPCVFASGDCASQLGHDLPKSGALAVRHGRVLAKNLRAASVGRPLVRFVPPARWLALIATGGKRAILSYGPFSAEGGWVWRLKDRIDRAYIAKHRIDAAATVTARCED